MTDEAHEDACFYCEQPATMINSTPISSPYLDGGTAYLSGASRIRGTIKIVVPACSEHQQAGSSALADIFGTSVGAPTEFAPKPSGCDNVCHEVDGEDQMVEKARMGKVTVYGCPDCESFRVTRGVPDVDRKAYNFARTAIYYAVEFEGHLEEPLI